MVATKPSRADGTRQDQTQAAIRHRLDAKLGSDWLDCGLARAGEGLRSAYTFMDRSGFVVR